MAEFDPRDKLSLYIDECFSVKEWVKIPLTSEGLCSKTYEKDPDLHRVCKHRTGAYKSPRDTYNRRRYFEVFQEGRLSLENRKIPTMVKK